MGIIIKAGLLASRWLMLKIRISDLDSTFMEFCSNLRKTSEKGGRPQEHVHFIIHQGQAGTLPTLTKLHKLLATRELRLLTPIVLGIMVGVMEGTFSSSTRLVCTTGHGEVAFCKVVNCRRLKLVRNPYMLQEADVFPFWKQLRFIALWVIAKFGKNL